MKNYKSILLSLMAIVMLTALSACDPDQLDGPYDDNPYYGQWYDSMNNEVWTFSNNYLGGNSYEGWITGYGYTDYFNYSYDYDRLYIVYEGYSMIYVYDVAFDQYGFWMSNRDGSIYLQWQP